MLCDWGAFVHSMNTYGRLQLSSLPSTQGLSETSSGKTGYSPRLEGEAQAMRLVPMRHCERCQQLRFVWGMRFVRRPLGGRPYWICRRCRHDTVPDGSVSG